VTSSESPQGAILVVEDEPAIRFLASQVLERAGFQVLVARDGREGVEVFQHQHRQVAGILLDLTMPRLDGLETLREIRCIRPDVKVVMMSGYHETDVVNRTSEHGLQGFLPKPFTPVELLAAVKAGIAGH
jgi:CheY-like chemotaxis protein